ncbi:GAF domain-containing protein [Streptomyces scopuliridis]|uniref:GAF domain-containing protein n=1 Tax=Streptomyces scopuliridis TaxID=452529 RepID=A0ACD4ZTD1_9ACTN|nr:GAF domain-containing protein [Streptomyces scopuliridis]WSC01706.1 GAF domain-containing protein [Streptomyces scopuliridis]WSC04755.1 GAF domain-containing protein [Streptomyces scopuliridis]
MTTTPAFGTPQLNDAAGTELDLARRVRRLAELGLSEQPDSEFDAFATELANAAGTPYAMVNLVSDRRQYFAGLHVPDPSSYLPPVNRVMHRDHGYCPDVMARAKPLVLPDVYSSPRFAGNAVVDLIGIRTYAGAPLIDTDGIVLGTVCVVGTEPRPLSEGRPMLDLIKTHRDSLMGLIHHRRT